MWNRGYNAHVGGPATMLMPEYLGDRFRAKREEKDAVSRFNPNATFTTRGCDRQCAFCGVSKIEGPFRELRKFEPRPVICDSNFLMSSTKHFDRVIDALKPLRGIDFNQGLDARLLTPSKLDRLCELNMKVFRFAWDSWEQERFLFDVIAELKAKSVSLRRIGVYVLVNFPTPQGDERWDEEHKMETLKKRGIRGFPMRYQPLNCLKKNSFIAPHWTEKSLNAFMQYWTKQRYYEHIPYAEWERR